MSVALPTNAMIQKIERQLMATLTFDDPFFDLFPMTTKDAFELEWEQEANFQGIQAGRGFGDPQIIRLLGLNRYQMIPGSYGEGLEITEEDIATRRKVGSFNEQAPETVLINTGQDYLLNRRINRMRKNGWDMLQTGTFQVPNSAGGYIDIGTYPFRTSPLAYVWSNLSSSTPLADMRALKLLHRGYSTTFGKKAKAFMNTTQVNYMLNNQNANDLGGKRREVGASIFSLADVNEILAAQDLPEIIDYDEGYFLDDGVTFQLFLATGKIVVVGDRPEGQTIGEFQMTRNGVNDDAAPGAYTFVTDSRMTGKPVPRWIRIDDGFVGGPVCFYPSSIVIMS